MQVIEVVQPGVDSEARWTMKGGKAHFGYKQNTLVDDNGLLIAVETTPANRHDSVPLLDLIDKAYTSQKHRQGLKARGIRNAIQDKAYKTAFSVFQYSALIFQSRKSSHMIKTI